MGQLEDMQLFIRIVESQGIGKAAEHLGIAKSAVSRRLSDLESRLGSKLISRTTRTSSLTQAGNQYYQHALTIIDQVEELNAQIEDQDHQLNGTLRMAVPLSFGLLHLGPAIDEFIRLHPKLNIQLDFSDRIVDIVEEGFDLALRIAKLKDSAIQARKICPSHHVLVASPSYLKTEGTPKTLNELAEHQFLKYGTNGNTALSIFDDQSIEHKLNLPTKMSANNGDFLLQMACSGHGIVMLPTFIAYKALQQKQLVQVLANHHIPSLNAFVVYPQNRFLPLRARALIDFLAERFGDQPYWDEFI